MSISVPEPHSRQPDRYLAGRGQAWFAFAMTFALMLFDYIDRQVIVSLFPHIKTEWGLSDKQLGGLVSVVSLTVAIGALPVALLADRYGRVRSVVAMALVWSTATVSCMFTHNYGQLLAARAVVGAGEAGYGAVGAALISSLFPARMRSALLGAFFAAASIGSVVGVLIGGLVTARWGWKAAFGVVGVPGLVLALLYLLVRDYRTVELEPRRAGSLRSVGGTLSFAVRQVVRSRTMLWVCIGGAMQLIVVSAVWAWLPSLLNRSFGLPVEQAPMKTALVVLCGAAGGVFWGWVVDRIGGRRARNRLFVMAVLCVATAAVFLVTFAATSPGEAQFAGIMLGGFLMTCAVGPATAVVIDVVHPGLRATGASVLALTQNLFGLAVGPFLAGALSDLYGLQSALALIALSSLGAAAGFVRAARSFDSDCARVAGVTLDAAPEPPAAPNAPVRAYG